MRMPIVALRLRLRALILAGGVLLVTPAQAQTGTGTAGTTGTGAVGTGSGTVAPTAPTVPGKVIPTQTYKSWALDCLVPKTGPSAGQRVCFIHHEVKATADPKLVAGRVVIRRSGPDRKLAMIVELPPNTVQATGATAVIDGGPPLSMILSGCIPRFCYGAIELTPELQAAVKSGHEMTLTFTPKDKGPQTIAVPLAGITAALAALEQTGS
jgi:invasion protein IalB